MFRRIPSEPALSPRLKKVLQDISQDVFGSDEEIHNLDLASIEQRAYQIGQRVARQLAKEAAAK